ncbi:unnamed protein product [Paramecium octaurelia]|uniref:Uncharacterized protein n=1 Tax=Paramecium octaurelia TaxID=43137 RepID=A0A8S1XIS1_PAROT|nr:unnamed protein product [Paramecium octaurelia]
MRYCKRKQMNDQRQIQHSLLSQNLTYQKSIDPKTWNDHVSIMIYNNRNQKYSNLNNFFTQ